MFPESLYVASLAMYAQQHQDGRERAPTLIDWTSKTESEITVSDSQEMFPSPAFDFRTTMTLTVDSPADHPTTIISPEKPVNSG